MQSAAAEDYALMNTLRVWTGHLCSSTPQSLHISQPPVQTAPGVSISRRIVRDHEELCGPIDSRQQAPLGVPIVIGGQVSAGMPDVINQLSALPHRCCHMGWMCLDAQCLRPCVCTARPVHQLEVHLQLWDSLKAHLTGSAK